MSVLISASMGVYVPEVLKKSPVAARRAIREGDAKPVVTVLIHLNALLDSHLPTRPRRFATELTVLMAALALSFEIKFFVDVLTIGPAFAARTIGAITTHVKPCVSMVVFVFLLKHLASHAASAWLIGQVRDANIASLASITALTVLHVP